MSYRHFTAEIRHVSTATILDLSGPLTMGEAVTTLRDNVQSLLASGTKKIAINLAGISYADSSGIGALMGALTYADAAGAKCKLFSIPKHLAETLKQLGTENVLDLSPNEATALAAWDKE